MIVLRFAKLVASSAEEGAVSCERFPTYSELLQIFQRNSSKKYNEFNRAIVNSGVPSIGCTVPFLRSCAKRYKHCFAEISALPIHACYEVDMLKGMALVLVELPFAQKLPLISEFVGTLENWAVCDSNTIKPNASESASYFDFFCELACDTRTFVCRYGLVNLLSSYCDEVHIDRIFALLGKVSYGSYYVDMAVAWLVSEAMAKCRSQTVVFLENDARRLLNVFSYNAALQKIRDSLRVSRDDKDWSRSLRR